MEREEKKQEVQNQNKEEEKELNLDDLGEVAGGGMAQAHVQKTSAITTGMKKRS